MEKFNYNLYHQQPSVVAYKIFYSAFYILLITGVFYSCDDFVTVDMPKNQLFSADVYEEIGTADAAMSAIYSRIRDTGPFTGAASGISMSLGNYTDELDFYGDAANGTIAFYNNTLVSSNPDVITYWNNCYAVNYAANSVIEGVTKSVQLKEEDRNRLKGEALFVRAFVHCYLTGLFGNVPYVTTTALEVNQRIGKKTVAEVYNQAIADLEQALLILPEDYLTQNRTRPNKYAAYALLARISLYAGKWDVASNAASAVINNTTLYPYESNLDLIFKKESTSTIWQLAPKAIGGNSLQASAFNFNSGPPPTSALSPVLMAAFEPGDMRRVKWIKTVSKAGNSWYQSYKYKQRTNIGTTVEMSILLRLGEVYLIRAEARAQTGELIGAKEDLNVIRNTAGLSDTPAVTKAEILDALLQERRIELFTEYGHRFFDLKRFGAIDAVLTATKTGWDSNDVLWPLPDTDLELNPNLAPQNPGY